MIPAGDAPLRISVVVASRGRPRHLLRCLMAVDQVVWPFVEVVVVADAPGRAAVSERRDIRLLAADAPGLAAARNAGVAAAGGDIIAFLDDDAVPEPMWLAAIAGAFGDADVGAVTGPVLGRNGISLQSGADTILSDATTLAGPNAAGLRRAEPGRAAKTVGTNMAFRADLLREAGGFDETFRFYLEDADLAMRLGAMGVVTAHAPLAVVHHATAASPRRRADRAPRDLTDIGRSTAAFLLRHHPADRVGEALAAARARERARAVRGLVSGALEPRDPGRLLAGFDAGVRDGLDASEPQLARFGPRPPFKPRPRRGARHVVVAGGPGAGARRKARAEAERQRKAGATVSLFLFFAGTFWHQVRYDSGIWVQRGGLWGRSERKGPLFRAMTRRGRLEAEIARISGCRGLDFGSDRLLPAGSVISVEQSPFF